MFFERGREIIQTVKPCTKSHIGNRQRRSQQHLGVLQAHALEELINRETGKGLKDPAEMKRADVAIGSQLLQGDVFRQVIMHVLLGLFDRGQVVFFQPGIYGLYGAVVGKASNHFFKNVHHEVIHFQLMGAGGSACLQEGEMQLFDLRVGSYQQRLHVFIGKEPMCMAVQQALDVFVKFLPEDNDGAGVGDLSGMLNGVFIPGFAYQYRTGVGIKRVAKSIVVEIT